LLFVDDVFQVVKTYAKERWAASCWRLMWWSPSSGLRTRLTNGHSGGSRRMPATGGRRHDASFCCALSRIQP